MIYLDILAVSADESLAHELQRVCRSRGYAITRLTDAESLESSIAAVKPDALLLDLDGRLDDELALASELTTRHPQLAIVAVGESPHRSITGVRVVDRWGAGERILDELELAYIGIPASAEEAELAGLWPSTQEEQP